MCLEILHDYVWVFCVCQFLSIETLRLGPRIIVCLCLIFRLGLRLGDFIYGLDWVHGWVWSGLG